MAQIRKRFHRSSQGSHLAGLCAEVYLKGARLDRPDIASAYESWCWTVQWEGWFARHGFEPSKQAAADKAIEECWVSVQTELRRDVDREAAMIAARVLVLLGEDAEFLQKVLWHLKNVYGDEMKRDAEPEPVKMLAGRLSEELHQNEGSVERWRNPRQGRQHLSRPRRGKVNQPSILTARSGDVRGSY